MTSLNQEFSDAVRLTGVIWRKHWLLLSLTMVALSTVMALPLLLWRAEKLIDHVTDTIFPAPQMALFLKRDLKEEDVAQSKAALQQALVQTLPDLQIVQRVAAPDENGQIPNTVLTPTVSPRAIVSFIPASAAQAQLTELGFGDALKALPNNPLPDSYTIEFIGLDSGDIARLPQVAKIITESLSSIEDYRIDPSLAEHTVRAHQYVMKWMRTGLIATGVAATAVSLALFTTLTLIAISVWRRDFPSESDTIIIAPALLLGGCVGLLTSLFASALNDILGRQLSAQAQSACSSFGMACPFDSLFSINGLLSHSGWLLAAAVSGALAAGLIAMIARQVHKPIQWEIIE
ncbi:hypothetical protein ACMYR3_14365 [Ampullimonas aquatilis]|uniref:hypothetical protein n=1 Tax=Ampullimonas aquatilis TaxID=1341549 RepID=UPI003C710E61